MPWSSFSTKLVVNSSASNFLPPVLGMPGQLLKDGLDSIRTKELCVYIRGGGSACLSMGYWGIMMYSYIQNHSVTACGL